MSVSIPDDLYRAPTDASSMSRYFHGHCSLARHGDFMATAFDADSTKKRTQAAAVKSAPKRPKDKQEQAAQIDMQEQRWEDEHRSMKANTQEIAVNTLGLQTYWNPEGKDDPVRQFFLKRFVDVFEYRLVLAGPVERSLSFSHIAISPDFTLRNHGWQPSRPPDDPAGDEIIYKAKFGLYWPRLLGTTPTYDESCLHVEVYSESRMRTFLLVGDYLSADWWWSKDDIHDEAVEADGGAGGDDDDDVVDNGYRLVYERSKLLDSDDYSNNAGKTDKLQVMFPLGDTLSLEFTCDESGIKVGHIVGAWTVASDKTEAFRSCLTLHEQTLKTSFTGDYGIEYVIDVKFIQNWIIVEYGRMSKQRYIWLRRRDFMYPIYRHVAREAVDDKTRYFFQEKDDVIIFQGWGGGNGGFRARDGGTALARAGGASARMPDQAVGMRGARGVAGQGPASGASSSRDVIVFDDSPPRTTMANQAVGMRGARGVAGQGPASGASSSRDVIVIDD